MAGFDWYQATIPAPVDDVLEACFGLSSNVRISHTRGRQGYATVTDVLDDGGKLGSVMHGGTHPHPNVQFTSDAAQAGAEMIRAVPRSLRDAARRARGLWGRRRVRPHAAGAAHRSSAPSG